MNRSQEPAKISFLQQVKQWWIAHYRLIWAIGAMSMLLASLFFIMVGGSEQIWLFVSIPLALFCGYFYIFPSAWRKLIQDWLVDHAFTVTAVFSIWIIGVLLILWVLVTLIWAPQDALPVSATVAETPLITVSHPHTILADGKAVDLLVSIENGTAVTQTTTLTITKSGMNPITFVENPGAMSIGKTWTVSPMTTITEAIGLVNKGWETAVFREPVSYTYTTAISKTYTTTAIAEGIEGARLRQFVTTTVNKASPLTILIAFLIPGVSAILQQSIKDKKDEREKEARIEQKRIETIRQQEETKRKEEMRQRIEKLRRQLRTRNITEAKISLEEIQNQQVRSELKDTETKNE